MNVVYVTVLVAFVTTGAQAQSGLFGGAGGLGSSLGGTQGGLGGLLSSFLGQAGGSSGGLAQITQVLGGLSQATGTCNLLAMTDSQRAFVQSLKLSSQNCDKRKTGMNANCAEKTMEATLNRIPSDTFACAQSDIVPEFAPVYRLCVLREKTRDLKSNDPINPYSWQDLLRVGNDAKLWNTQFKLQAADVNRCKAQINAEQWDCTNGRKLMCAFTAQQSFNCATPAQLARRSKTAQGADECEIISLRLVQERDAQGGSSSTSG